MLAGMNDADAARQLGRKGGLARAHKLSKSKRSAIARKAVEERWRKHRSKAR